MPGVYYSNQNNSTLFTECCSVAITEHENNCPECGEEINKSFFTAPRNKPSRRERLELGLEE